MTSVTLNVGIAQSDRMQPLLERTVTRADIDLRFDLSAVDNIFWRALHSDDFDVSEMSLAAYCILTSRDENPFIGIPVFTSRMFRHNSVYIRANAGIKDPSDLRGRRIGIPEYQMTAVVWMRGLLENEYGVTARDVHWFKGGVGKPGRVERIPLRLPEGYHLTEIPAQDTLDAYLLEGKIDAIISAKMPPSFMRGDPKIARLFPDSRSVEVEYFRATQIFPIMHVLVMRRRVYEKNPALAMAVYQAFDEAKALSAARAYDTDALPYMVPWLVEEMERTYSIMGRDLWPYGVGRNRHCLETFLSYLRQQDLLERAVGVDDLFAPEFKST